MGRIGSEWARKSVHIAMGLFALALRWLGPWEAAACAAGALLFNLLVLHRLTGRRLLREGERRRAFSWGIALYPAMVLLLILVFRDRLEIAAGAWALLAFGDGAATLVGMGLGGPRLPWNPDKRWSGGLAFVVAGTLAAAGTMAFVGGASWASPSLWWPCLVAALLAAWVESLPTGVDDNILVPWTAAAVLFSATLVDPVRFTSQADAILHHFLVGTGVNLVLAIGASLAGGVGRSGAVAGFLLGTALYTFGRWPSFAMLVAFFVLGTAATKAGYAKKAALGIAQEKGGRRGARNALANTGAGVCFAFLALGTWHADLFRLAVAAAFATAASDTVSSEIGQAYGKRHFLITTFRRVPAGTDGAVSAEGTIAGILASALLALLAWRTGLTGAVGLAIVPAAAFVGTTLESYLGAAFEAVDRLDNEFVNFTNTVAGGLAAIGLAVLL